MINTLMPYCDWEYAGKFIEKSNWRTAKTYADTYPHAYTLRKECNPKEFEQFARLIRKYGYYYNFFKQRYIQLNVNDYYYWTMGWPASESTVINRKERKITDKGSQGLKALFDTLSDYDMRGDEFDRMEIAGMIKPRLNGRVLEIGCGSGLMTQLLDIKREDYLGIDPSWRMIEEFRKAQNLIVWHTDFESVNLKRKYDFVFAFGSASYVRPEYWERLSNILSDGGTYLLTFYTSGYAKPMDVVWKAGGVHFYADDIPTLAGETQRTELGEYTIIEGKV